MTNSLPWKITVFKNGKPSISMGHLHHGELLVPDGINGELLRRDLPVKSKFVVPICLHFEGYSKI